MKLVSEARKRIEEGSFKKWKEQMIKKLSERL
jgi:queuine/archaeosine tRNA-ribosyltransferase